MNTRLLKTQTARPFAGCGIPGCPYTTTEMVCIAHQISGAKIRESIAPSAPEPSAPVLREVDAVGCDSGEASRRAETTADFLTAVTLLAIIAGIGIAVHFLMSGGQ